MKPSADLHQSGPQTNAPKIALKGKYVLKVISRSTFDLDTVLAILSKSAAELCDASQCVIFMRDGEVFRGRSEYGSPPEYVMKFLEKHPVSPGWL